MSQLPLLPFPSEWEPTRSTLHHYAQAVGHIAGRHAVPHPKWWHVSLQVRPTGLVTDAMPVPGGGTLWIRMDLNRHEVVVEQSNGSSVAIAMNGGLTGSQMGDALIDVLETCDLAGEYDRGKFESDEPRAYEAEAAKAFFDVIVNVNHNLESHRVSLGDSVGPLQIWPHGFDLAFEWFGNRVVRNEELGESAEQSSQLNLGLYPGGRPYFYSNPWPFDSALTELALPEPAVWNTEGWEGSMLYYDELLETEDPAQRLIEYAQAVFAAAAPTLTNGT